MNSRRLAGFEESTYIIDLARLHCALQKNSSRTSETGHKRHLLKQTAAPRLPLRAVSDQPPAAPRYVATGQFGLIRRSKLRLFICT
jgi:hypothetical protein